MVRVCTVEFRAAYGFMSNTHASSCCTPYSHLVLVVVMVVAWLGTPAVCWRSSSQANTARLDHRPRRLENMNLYTA